MYQEFSSLAVVENVEPDKGYFIWRLQDGELLLDVLAAYQTLGTDRVHRVTHAVELKVYWEPNREFIFLDDPRLYTRFAPPYALPRVLATYGEPSHVFYRADKGLRMLDLIVFFMEAGVRAQYTTSTLLADDDTFALCPANARVALTLWSQDNSEVQQAVLEEVIRLQEWSRLDGWYASLEEATSLTIADFYRAFSNPQPTSCLESSTALWPEP